VVRRAAGLATRPGNIPHHFDQFSGIMLDILMTLCGVLSRNKL
jgi:hypothetical protein